MGVRSLLVRRERTCGKDRGLGHFKSYWDRQVYVLTAGRRTRSKTCVTPTIRRTLVLKAARPEMNPWKVLMIFYRALKTDALRKANV